nr:MAG TPA: hypothetical protein [Caudoviricetes sp.]
MKKGCSLENPFRPGTPQPLKSLLSHSKYFFVGKLPIW